MQVEDGAPIINVHGGKLTTYRKLALSVMEKIASVYEKRGKDWTGDECLPGGDFPATGFADEVEKLKGSYPFLKQRHARRLVRLYGTIAHKILGDISEIAGLGILFGDDLYEIEVIHLIENEWALSVEDILWRRTKRGLWFSPDQVKALEKYLNGRTG